jgi:O-antigen/teichoic acid export membrane protein
LQVFLARIMDLGDYGSYVTAWTWLVMLGAFAPLGIAESAVRFLPRYRARGRHGSARAFFRFGLRVRYCLLRCSLPALPSSWPWPATGWMAAWA